MGLNWSAGLNALSEGLQVQAGDQARGEAEAIQAMREENLTRLRAKLSEESQGRLFEQQDKMQTKRDEAIAARQEKHDTAMADRQDKTLKSQESRYFSHLERMQKMAQDAQTSAEKRASAAREVELIKATWRDRQEASAQSASALEKINRAIKDNPSIGLLTGKEREKAIQGDPILSELYGQYQTTLQRQQQAETTLQLLTTPGMDTPGDMGNAGTESPGDAFSRALKSGGPSRMASPDEFAPPGRRSLIQTPDMPSSLIPTDDSE